MSKGPLTTDVSGILDTIDIPIIVVGCDCTVLRFNRAASAVLGLVASDVGQRLCSTVALGDATELEGSCEQVVADEAPVRRDFQRGDRRFLVRIAPYVPATGEIAGAVLTFTNVTAFRASLEQAVYEREYTKAILNTVGNPLVVLDSQLCVQSANRAFYSMFGVSREQSQGAPFLRLGDDAWKASRLGSSLKAVFSDDGKFELFEIERHFPELGLRTIVLDARQISSTTILVAAQDITERKQAAAALQEKERRFREMVDALPVAIYTTDALGKITHFNPAAAEFAGRTPRLGEDHWCVTWKLYRTDGTPLPHDQSSMARALQEARPIRGEEAIAERPSGERRWFEPHPMPLFDDTGRLTGGVNVLLDVTERKAGEAALRDADRRKDEFLALLAHELRNPLAPIRTGLEVIRRSGDTPESVLRVRAMMERQINQMVRLVDDLLDVSRIASGKIVLQRAPTSVAEVVHGAIEAHRAAIEAAQIDLSVELPELPLMIDVDPTRFVQVLSNVLHNACKFTPAQGQIRVRAEIDAATVSPWVTITVADTGIGISKEMMPRVFELFTQAEQTTQRARGGLGIGLALARRLVEMHGGEMVGYSDGPGKGTSFVVKMPLHEAVVPQRPQPHPEIFQVTSRVVIIDDNKDAANTVSMLVEQLGGSARMAHDAQSGLTAVQEFRPDVVLLDIGMPGMDGYETCRRLRRTPLDKRIVIVALTGWGQAQDKQRALDAGFDVHLTKPVDPAMLLRVLASNPTAGVEPQSEEGPAL